MPDKPLTLTILISTRSPLWQQALTALMLPVSVSIIPAMNHYFLGGAWTLDIIGSLVGLLWLIGLFKSNQPTRRVFKTPEEAAEWVRGYANHG